jgi:cysteine desulfurase / selenocysteine lyase
MVGFDLKKQFPILGNNDLVYLDNAATTQRPRQMIDAISNFYAKSNANVCRGLYPLGEKATVFYEEARDIVANFINAADRSEIIFTSGTTESINFVAEAWAVHNLREGDEILLTQVEHHANMLPWQRVADKVGARLRFIEVDQETFELKLDDTNLINHKTKLVAVSHCSNVIGNIWGENFEHLQQLISKAHGVGAKVLIDGAQSVPHYAIDLQMLDADFFVFSGHKMCGPTGVGVLYIKKDLHETVEPYQLGGSMIYEATFKNATWLPAPQKFEAGTPPIAQVIGLAETINFIKEYIPFDEQHKHETKLCSMLVEELEKLSCIRIIGNVERLKNCGHLVSFVVDGVHAHDVAGFLGSKGISMRAGHHCVQPFTRLLGIEASVRASFYAYNTMEDVDKTVIAIKDAVSMFRNN